MSDSGIDTDMSSEYTSINSTNYRFHEEGGRRCDPHNNEGVAYGPG